jgi:hypothetical protein
MSLRIALAGSPRRGEETMRRSLPQWTASALTALIAVTPSLATDASSHAFIGTDKCKMCHNLPAKGAQYTHWAASPHAKAFAVLATEEAKKTAAAKGIADPQKAPECLECHVTGFGAPKERLIDKYRIEDGVGCESCHGPGGDYWKMEVMKDHAKSVAAGMRVPDEKTCTGCHNSRSPNFKAFDYQASLAKIAHPNPQRAPAK